MGLINLKTDLKNLKYGKDRKGGGDSGQPYIKSNIPDGLTSSSPDFLLRNGYLNPVSTANDVSRLTQMFFDLKTPNGLLFIAKQNLLSRTAVKTQTSTDVFNNGVYNPLSTLAQTGVVSIGGHLNKQGINPFELTGAYSNNANLYGVKVKSTQELKDNRLVLLKNAISQNSGIKLSNSIILNSNETTIITYDGGPGSNLGIGQTNIRFESNGNLKTLSSPPTIDAKTSILNNKGENNNPSTYSTKQLDNVKPQDEVGYTYGKVKQDFRAELRKNINSSTILSNSPDYLTKNIENRVLLGDPGRKQGKNLSSYTNGSGIGPVDKINALPIYRSQWATTEDNLKNDLVKFRIAAIDGDKPNFKTFMHFRAFLDSFSDSYTGDWGSTKYLGRGENFYNYTGFNRIISLSWTVAAQSKEELIPMYKKLNYLASNLAPDYSKSGYMRGPLMQMTVGGYLYEQVGFFTSLTYEIPSESPWEIGINDNGGEDRTVKELPHIIKVQASFTPIHDFVPSKQDLEFDDQLKATINDKDGKPIIVTKGFVNGYGVNNQRFIALAVGSGSQYNNYDESSAYQVGNGKYTVA
jgi:hypothetical protein